MNTLISIKLPKAILIGLVVAIYASPAHALPDLPADVPVKELPNTVYKASAEIEQWKISNDSNQMKAHAWRLFAALMEPKYNNNGATIRTYDTWYTLDEAVPEIGAKIIQFDVNGMVSPRKKVKLTRTNVDNLGGLSTPNQRAPHFLGATRRVTAAECAALPTPLPENDNRTLSETLVSDVKYSTAINKWIINNLMNKNGQTVTSYNLKDKLVAGSPAALPFDDTKGVMVKPSYTIVKGAGPTIIGRWREDIAVVNATAETVKSPVNANNQVAGERTWVKEAVVFPPGMAMSKTFYGRDGTILPKVNVTDFHYFKITAAIACALKSGINSELMSPNIQNIAEGDYAVLTSMHISTREVDDWTWQTFWWEPKPHTQADEKGLPSELKSKFTTAGWKPLSYFKLGVGYDYQTPDGKNIISSNPYLEGAFGLPKELEAVYGKNGAYDASGNETGVNVFIRDVDDKPILPYTHEGNGLKTNCITCHKAAAYHDVKAIPVKPLGNLPATSKGKYPDYGKLNGTEDLFKNKLQTHFMWGVANKVMDREQ
ncbi:MAG: hypothetical protein ABL920_07170 [Methylotenera sp.]